MEFKIDKVQNEYKKSFARTKYNHHFSFSIFTNGCKSENPVSNNKKKIGLTETLTNGPEPLGNIDTDYWLPRFDFSPNDSMQSVFTLMVKSAFQIMLTGLQHYDFQFQ